MTGGTGYVGGRLMVALAERRHAVRVGSRGQAPAAAAAGVTDAAVMDWNSDESLAAACRGIDAVVHAAGMGAAECRADPVAALQFNGVATARLVRAAQRAGVRRFLYLSTMHVYGTALQGIVDESTCPQPVHPYASSHRAGEDAVLAADAGAGMRGMVLRLSNSFGAPAPATRGDECWRLVANDLCRQGATSGRLALQTAGRQRRDFIAMAEACRAILHCLDMPDASAGAALFNVGGDWAPSLLELAQFVAASVQRVSGRSCEITTGSATDSVGAAAFCYSTSRLRSSGFEPDASAAAREMDRLAAHCLERPAPGGHAA